MTNFVMGINFLLCWQYNDRKLVRFGDLRVGLADLKKTVRPNSDWLQILSTNVGYTLRSTLRYTESGNRNRLYNGDNSVTSDFTIGQCV